VQEWVAKHLETLEILTRQKIRGSFGFRGRSPYMGV